MPRGRPRTTPLPTLADITHNRAPTEAVADYEAFVTFARLGSGRTLPKVAEETGRSLRAIQQLSARRAWRHRVDSWERDHAAAFTERLAEEQARIAARQVVAGAAVEALLTPSESDVAALDAKDRLTAFVNVRRDNRAAAGMNPNSGPTVAVSVESHLHATADNTITASQVLGIVRLALADDHPDAYRKVLAEITAWTSKPAHVIQGALER